MLWMCPSAVHLKFSVLGIFPVKRVIMATHSPVTQPGGTPNGVAPPGIQPRISTQAPAGTPGGISTIPSFSLGSGIAVGCNPGSRSGGVSTPTGGHSAGAPRPQATPFVPTSSSGCISSGAIPLSSSVNHTTTTTAFSTVPSGTAIVQGGLARYDIPSLYARSFHFLQ